LNYNSICLSATIELKPLRRLTTPLLLGVFAQAFFEKACDTSAGIRTRVRALATPGDNRYTTDVLWCPDPDSNRGQLPLQGSALPLSYLGRQNCHLIMNSNLFFTFQKISGIFEWAR
jgi:hypothetical protein